MLIVYIGLFIVLLYTIIMCIKTKGIPTSVSETYYLGGGIWFTLVMFASSFLITAGLLNLSDGSIWLFISFLTGAGMGFVGAAPLFKNEMEGKVHYAGAITLLVGSLLWLLIFSNPSILFLWVPSVYWIFTNLRMFWCEITCIVTVLIGGLFVC